jgi:hypothetical protein
VSEPLRVALLAHDLDTMPQARELAAALRRAGQRPTVMTAHRRPTAESLDDGVPVRHIGRLPELPLRLRGFTGPLTQVPLTLRELMRSEYDVAQAFSPEDAVAPLAWRRRTGRAVVFSPAEPLIRERVANRRLRLRLVSAALDEADMVIAPTEESREALSRWLALDAPLVRPGDAAAHEALYRRLLSR